MRVQAQQASDSLLEIATTNTDEATIARAYFQLAQLPDTTDTLSEHYYNQGMTHGAGVLHDSVLAQATLDQCATWNPLGRYLAMQPALESWLPRIDAMPYLQQFELQERLAWACSQLGQNAEAQEHYFAALRLAQSQSKLSWQYQAEFGLALLHLHVGEYDEAIVLLEKMLADTVTSNRLKRGQYANSLAGIQFELENYETAKAYYMLNLQLWEESGTTMDPFQGGITLLNIAVVYYRLNMMDSTAYYLTRATEVSLQSGNQNFIANVYSTVGNILTSQGKFAEAEENLLKSTEFADASGDVTARLQAWKNLADNYKDWGKATEAYEACMHYVGLIEERYNDKSTADLAKQRKDFEFEAERKEARLQQEKASLEIAAADSKANTLTLGVLALVVLLLVGAYALYRNSKAKQLIAVKNEALEASVKERELLIHEIHHRVKNNLQLVSSLLQLQARSLTDDDSKAVFEEGQNRVQAMALIHQKLYQRDVGTGIDFKEYLSELIGHYATVNDAVQVEINCPNLELDIDTAIPIGLIVNELVTNSFKYAFGDQPMPKLNLQIEPREAGNYQLVFSDNGKGLPADFDWQKSRTLGMRLVRSLAKQLLGKVEYEYDNHLSTFVIYFKSELGRRAVA